MLSITTSLRTFGCCIAAVLILPGLGTPRSAGAQSTPARPPLRSAVFPADTGRVRGTHAAVVRALVDTVTSNLSRVESHVTTLGPGESPHPPQQHAHEELMIVRTGTLEVLQNGATRHAGPGAVIFGAPNDWHGLCALGPASAAA